MPTKEVADLLSALASHRKRQKRARPKPAASRGSGTVDQSPGSDADLAERAIIFAVDFRIENQLWVGRAMQPAIGLDLALELPGRPPGIAECEQRLVGAGALGDVAQDVDGGGEAHALVDRQRALGLEIVGAVQDEAAAGLHR